MSFREWLVDLDVSTMEYHVGPCHGPNSPAPGCSEPMWMYDADVCRELTYSAST